MRVRAALFSVLFSFSCLAFAGGSELPLIPLPSKVDQHQGQLLVGPGTTLRVAPSDTAGLRVAHAFSDMLARMGGPSLPVVEGLATPERAAAGASIIVIRLDANARVTSSEGYVLDVSPGEARIVARDESGLYYGAVTLWQLLTANQKGSTFAAPAVHIEDWPQFAWRGLMIDSARHKQSVEEIERILDQMALHKLNTLHWHLTDDQGWRIEIKRYPELTRIGAWRTPPDAGKNGELARYGGYYTQDQIRAVVAYAQARHITIVPELDMPGHAQAAVASYPQFGVTGERPTVSADWGINPYLYNADDNTLHFLQNVLDEVMALFPSRYIHLGGDEAIKDQWNASPAVQAKMRAFGLKNAEQLQSWFMGRLGQYLHDHGRHLIGWDEILEGGVPGDAAVMSWRGTSGVEKAIHAGHDVVVAPDPYLYLDYVQSSRDDETAGRLPVRSLQSVYTFRVAPKGLPPQQAQRILGAQANVWTEHMPSDAHLQHAIFPRLDAVAEIVWTPAGEQNWQSFLTRLSGQLDRYRRQDIHYADSAFAVNIDVSRQQALATGTTTVTLSNQVGGETIRYTVDGTSPDANSPIYKAPFTVKLPTRVRAVTMTNAGQALSQPRERVIDDESLRSVAGNELSACPTPNVDEMRAQPTPDATSMAPVYTINNFDSCRLSNAIPLDGVRSIDVGLARLPRNVALAHDATLIVQRKAATPHGEMELRADRCDGPAFATVPLPDPASSPSTFALKASVPPMHGTHAICVLTTASPHDPYYGVARLQLHTAGTASAKGSP
ncbi:beta-N-acetylhexosaminidase [Dyella psychrodurans]|uniref:beta-N-acetylhexosaminidase n=1 Tax=Dyella psychrodurans TaxID=1927960 RepID=A0A370X7T5_9GAMM|nr:family 20 glycosylhydrolase [Dyella psychrodurans]RDS84275.1 beta-hexosaminidase [Dyella psychrodurans]